MDIKIEGQEARTEKEIAPASTPLVDDDQLGQIALAQLFDMEMKEVGKYKDKIQTLLAWAKPQVDEGDYTNLKWVIKNLESRVGSPNFGETRIAKVARYAYLDMEGKRLEAEKLSLTR